MARKGPQKCKVDNMDKKRKPNQYRIRKIKDIQEKEITYKEYLN